MKTHLKTLALAVAIVLFASANSYSALNAYLKIKGASSTKIVKLDCPNGTCTTTVDGMAPGSYTFTLCDASGTPLAMKAKEKANRSTCTSTLIVSPRDAASGLPTGKRMHKPMTFTKTIDKASPILAITGDVDCDGSVDISFTCKSSDGGIMAMDDWETPSTR